MSLNWGILGPGRIAGKFADAVGSIPDTRVTAVASRSLDRAQEFGRRFGIPRQLGSYEELAASSAVDAIYIATPHRFHCDQAMLCLEAGKHVLCEKSITVNATELETLVNKAKEKNLFLMEALWTRFLPIYAEARSWINAGLIGEPLVLESTFCFPLTDDRPDRLWRHDLAGGALLDIGVYNIAISQWAMGQNPEKVTVVGRLNESNVDEQVSAILEYRSRTPGGPIPVSQFTCGFHSDAENDFNIAGTKGSIKIHPRFWQADTATLRSPNKPDFTVEAAHKHNGFEYQIEAVNQCIKDGKIECEQMTLADSLANMKLMDQIREAIGLKYDFE